MNTLRNAVVCFAFALVLTVALAPRIEGEGKEYYDAAHSSAKKINADDRAIDIIKVIGAGAESVTLALECSLDEILARYNAHVVFTESVGEVTSYYCRAYALGGGVRIRGRIINLHVASAPYGYTVGTPIICGGY